MRTIAICVLIIRCGDSLALIRVTILFQTYTS